MIKVTEKTYRYVNRLMNKWRSFWCGEIYPKSARLFGIVNFITLEDNISYGIADKMDDYLFLVNEKDPQDVYIKECISEHGETYVIDMEEDEDFDNIINKFVDTNRKTTPAMTNFLNYINYGEVGNRNEMKSSTFIILHFVLLIPIIINFISLRLSDINVLYNNIQVNVNYSIWIYSVIAIVILLIGMYGSIKQSRTFGSIWNNTITAIGLTLIIVLIRVSPVIVISSIVVLIATSLFYILKAYDIKDASNKDYIRVATQKLKGAFHVSRSLLTAAASLFILMFIIYTFLGQIKILADNIQL